ncbi:MAG: FKBP-type peptidyl-prolyl cis-trans isomerase [Methylophilaceae bacterium]|nr:FKBP-type peptidyl-prolyl cis-trans isomerase [Methylophilaceae bacterium]
MNSIRFTTMVCCFWIVANIAVAGGHVDTSNEAKLSSQRSVTNLEVVDRVVGTGKEAMPGARVQVHYTGWLFDPSRPEGRGRKFDSSLDRGEPFAFFLGGGQVIRGWDEGVAGMKVGGKRILMIPSHMAYGARGVGDIIPPHATLLFEVELLDVQSLE